MQVWYLPGVAERFGIGTLELASKFGQLLTDIDEATLRRSLFEHTGGSYPEARTYRRHSRKPLTGYSLSPVVISKFSFHQ